MAVKKRKSKYKAPPRVKVGRCWYVVGYDKKPIIGLSWDKGNGYYYFTHFKDDIDCLKSGKRPQFGKDYDNAIRLFRSWKDKGKTITIEEVNQDKIDVHFEYKIPDKPYRGDVQVNLTEEHIIAKAKEIFGKYPPSLVAEKFGMPSLAKIDYVDDLKEPYTLKQIGDCYFNKVEFENPTKEQDRELKKVKKVWEEFCRTVKAKTGKELTKEEIKEFYNDIYRECKKKKYSTTWMKGRFERVKRVFNNAIDNLDGVDDIIQSKLKLSSVLKSPKSEVREKAYRIPKEHFHKILEHSNVEERCMWLISMNLAYYSVDVANLPLSAIDFDEKTVVFRRGKTGEHRSGVLWDITIEAIKDFKDNHPHNGHTLFWNRQDDKPYLPNRIRKKFVAVIEEAKLREKSSKRLCHRNFRDSMKSIGIEMGIRNASIDAVMGHHIKHDEYVDPEVFPKISEDACRAVYEYYFEGSN